jgi:Haem-binding uptake, Tiki superfamily, ChaN
MRRSSKAGERRSAAQMHALAAVRREIVSRDTSNGRKYLREYTQAFLRYDAALTAQQLEQQIASADLVLIGDYHALPASQRYAASLVEQIASKRAVVLGVEAFLSRDQAILDAWWRRKISEQELRLRLRFDHDWGYSWEPVLELLSSARDHSEGAYALDCMPRNDMRRIRSRDRHAAAKICEMRQRHPGTAIVVTFGESHMAPDHLPRLVKELLPGERVLTVLQNVDALYWQAVGENAAAVSAGPDTVCVFNSSPLEKYESYRLCLERWHGDDQPDFAPAVYNLIFSLARTLGFRLDSPHNGAQPRYLADSLPEVVNVGDISAEIASATQKALEEHGCCYVASNNTFFVHEFRMPHVAAEAARFLHHACQGGAMQHRSCNSSVEDALAHFGARLLSPGTQADEFGASADGEKLYQAYLEGRLTRAGVRRLFLSHTETAEQANAMLVTVRAI